MLISFPAAKTVTADRTSPVKDLAYTSPSSNLVINRSNKHSEDEKATFSPK